MTLFINTISNSVTGTALFSLPNPTGGGYTVVEGFLSEDPAISLHTNWESVIPDATALSDFTQIMGCGATSWLSTSKASWKGTDPIKLTLNFYLLTFKKAQLSRGGKNQDMPVSEQAARFAALLAVSPKANNSNGFFSDFGIDVHGGYRPNYFQQNSDFSGATENSQNAASQDTYRTMYNLDEDLTNGEGTIQIIINGGGKKSAVFTKMLLEDATFTPSTVRTGYWEGNSFVKSSEPLYIKVSAQFRLMHSATVEDTIRMFTGRSSL